MFHKKLEDISRSSGHGLVGDFNLPGICWDLNTLEKRQSKKFLGVWRIA